MMSLLKNLSVFFVVFVLSLVSAQYDIELSPQSDGSLDEIQELLQKVQALYEEKIASKVQQGAVPEEDEEEKDVTVDGDNAPENTRCRCTRLRCTCCKRICVPKLGINQNYCLSLTYVPASCSIQVTVKAGWQVIITRKVSVVNPQPICVPISCRMRGVTVCLRFYSVRIAARTVCGCSKIIVRCPKGVVKIVNLGCFRMKFLDAATKQVEGSPQSLVNDQEPVYAGEIPVEVLMPAADNGKL